MPEPTASKTKVLIIDDDPSLSSLYKMTFMAEGMTVITASDGEQGLKSAKESHPNVILLDLMMPKMDGKEFLRQVKSDPETNSIPVIVLTALMEALERDEVMKLGAAEYMTKNETNPQSMTAKVNEVLQH